MDDRITLAAGYHNAPCAFRCGRTVAMFADCVGVCKDCGANAIAQALAAGQGAEPVEAARALVERAASFAKYHAEHAGYGGASREFHELAQTWIEDVAAALDRLVALKEMP